MGRKIKLSENIGLQLKEFRTKYKVKGKDIAELLGKSPAYVSKLEKGQIQQIEKDELVKITNYITFDNSYSYQRSILDFLLVNCPYSLTEYNYNGIGGYKIKLQEEYPSVDFDFIFNLLDSITIVQNDFNMTLNLDKAPAFIEELFNLVKINPDTYPYFKVICEYVNDDVKEMYEQKYNNLMEKQR